MVGSVEKSQLSDISPQNIGPYVHPCASRSVFQEKIASIEEEATNHRELDTHINSFLKTIHPSECCVKAYEHRCTGPEVHVVHRPVYNPDREKGHRNVCPPCSGSDSKRKAHSTFHEILAFNWKNLRFIELTTPEDFVPPENYNDPNFLKERYNQLFAYVKKFMKKEFPNEAYNATIHTWPSSTPLSPPHFHVHIHASCTEYQQAKDGQISVRHLNPVLSKAQLDRLRASWADILEYDGEVDIHYSYSPRRERGSGTKKYGGPKRLLHRLSYVYRGYIEDVNKWMTKNNIQSLDESEEYWLKWHLQKWPRKTRRYGAWSNYRQKQFVDMAIVESRKSADAKESRILYCGKCFYELENKSFNGAPVPFDINKVAVRRIIHMKRPPPHCMYEVTPGETGTKIRALSKSASRATLAYQAKTERKMKSEIDWNTIGGSPP